MTATENRVTTGLRSGPLTWGQQLLWLGYLATPPDRRSGHTVVQAFDVPGDASTAMVAEALTTLADRHETLRTTFHLPGGGDAYQVVHEPQPIPVAERTADDLADGVAAATAELRAVSFDLAVPGLVRAILIVVDSGPARLLVATHHIVIDGWSWGVLRREFDTLVRAWINGVAPALPPVPWQPLDQADAEHSESGQRANAAALRYWEHQLTMLPDRVLPGGADEPSGQHIVVMESPAFAAALRWLSARYRIVDATLILAAFCAVLGVVTGRDRAIVMTMSSNRLGSRTRDLVACHAQYTVVNLDLRGDPSFAELVARAGAAVLTAYRHGHYDFQQMKALESDRARRRGVVFSQPAGFNFKRYATESLTHTDPGPPPSLSTSDTMVDVQPFGGNCARGVVLLSVRPAVEATGLELLCDGAALASTAMTDLVRAMETWVLAGMAEPAMRLSALPELCGVRPPALGVDWALVDHCWVYLPDVAHALRECPGVTGAGAFADQAGSLVAYVAGTAQPADLRDQVLKAAAAGRAVIAPHRYVVCGTAPTDERDLAAWQRMARR